MSLSERIDALLERVEKPVRYMGGEFGCVMKDPESVDVRYAFLFPDTYEVGMSHLGMTLSYHQCARGRLVRARVFAVGGYGRAHARGTCAPVFSGEPYAGAGV